MKKALILSDTHSNNNFTDIFRHEQFDFTLFAGDSQLEEDSKYLENIDYIVKGNCDYAYFSEYLEFVKYNTKFFLTHGHLFNVKLNIDNLIYRALEHNVDVCVYGHTHIVHIEYLYDDNLLILNPGSYSLGRGENKNTYIILEFNEYIYKVTLKDSLTYETIKYFEYTKNSINKKEETNPLF